MIMGYPFYPHGSAQFAARVRTTLELPVDTPVRIQDGTLLRFLNWHRRQLQPPQPPVEKL